MGKINIALSAGVKEESSVVKHAYLNAIWDVGAIPTILQPRTDDFFMARVAEEFDGFVFCGGDDIDPKYYGENINGSKNICSIRDGFESDLFKVVYSTGKPILGICRGLQVINVFCGGSLHQHIDGHVQRAERKVRTHGVKLRRGGLLERIEARGCIEVNSFHHQAVKNIADNLVVDAVSDDGYIEAVYDPNHIFLLGVQWHPECYYSECKTGLRVFEAFAKACER